MAREPQAAMDGEQTSPGTERQAQKKGLLLLCGLQTKESVALFESRQVVVVHLIVFICFGPR